MSTGGKVLLGVGIGCGVVLLLCCGVFGVAGYYFSKTFQLIQDPDQVRTIAQRLSRSMPRRCWSQCLRSIR